MLVGPGQRLGPLAPGVYGRLQVLNGGAVTLSAGAFTFCDVKTGRGAAIRTLGPAHAAFVAPDARISFGRDAHLVGCFCTDRAKSDKHITLECPAF